MKVYMAFFTVGLVGITGGLINASKVSDRGPWSASWVVGGTRLDSRNGDSKEGGACCMSGAQYRSAEVASTVVLWIQAGRCSPRISVSGML